MYDLTGKTIVEIKDYVNSLSNEELDKFIEDIQYSHGGEAEITFD